MVVLGVHARFFFRAVPDTEIDALMSALGDGLFSIGIPKDSVLSYETQIKAGKFVVIAHGNRDEVDQARTVLTGATHHEGKAHGCCA